MRKELELATYEGLIFATAARYASILDDDIEDIQQCLRIKVWKALAGFDPARNRIKTDDAIRRWVFSCVANGVKDLLKSQSRRDARRDGRQLYIEDYTETDAQAHHFEARYLAEARDDVYFDVEEDGVKLPSTLTSDEKSVVYLLLLDFNQTEISVAMSVTRDQVRRLHGRVQEKMQDWKPGDGSAARLPLAA